MEHWRFLRGVFRLSDQSHGSGVRFMLRSGNVIEIASGTVARQGATIETANDILRRWADIEAMRAALANDHIGRDTEARTLLKRKPAGVKSDGLEQLT
jgi:hypothetical protein